MLQEEGSTKFSNITSRLVSIEGSRGLRIVGYIDEGDEANWNERFVILAPRYGETKKNNLELAYTLAANGFKVLRFDQTNHLGESDGAIDQFTLSGVTEDILAAVGYVDGYFEPSEIILISLSLSARCAIRACTQDTRISRLINMVGVVDIDKTLKAIYLRDIFGEFVNGADWQTIDILGFEIDAANFHQSMIETNMQSLAGTLADAEQIVVPVLHVYAERDLWVSREDVDLVTARCARGEVFEVPGVGHEIKESSAAVEATYRAVLDFAMQGLPGASDSINQPDRGVVSAQNKMERSRLKEAIEFDESEENFWSSYLGKFGIIEEAKHYVDYFSKVVELLGVYQSNDVILDIGCGNGFYGINVMRGLFMESAGLERKLNAPVHYCGIDLTPNGLSCSYSRHTQELIDLQKEYLTRVGDVGFSYRRMDFDTLNTDGSKRLPFSSHSVSKICSSLLISYLKDPLALMRELYRVLKPDGVAVISSMKPGCDMTALYHDSIVTNYSDTNDCDAKVLLSAAGEIKLKQDLGIYRFFTSEELERLAFDAGFFRIRSFRSFGDQANLLRVVK